MNTTDLGSVTRLDAYRQLLAIGTVDGPQQPATRVIYEKPDPKKLALKPMRRWEFLKVWSK